MTPPASCRCAVLKGGLYELELADRTFKPVCAYCALKATASGQRVLRRGRVVSPPVPRGYRVDHVAERTAEILVGFYRLATAFHATHSAAGLWLTCPQSTCRANAAKLRRWRDEDS